MNQTLDFTNTRSTPTVYCASALYIPKQKTKQLSIRTPNKTPTNTWTRSHLPN